MSARSDHAGAFEVKGRELCEGFRRAFPASDQPVIFGGRKMTLAEVSTALGQMEQTFAVVHEAELTFRQAVANRRRAMKAHRSTYGDAVVFLKHHLGRESPALVDFGIRPPKTPRPLSVEARAIARAKAAATRRARRLPSNRHRPDVSGRPVPTPPTEGSGGCPAAPSAQSGPSAAPAPEDAEPNGER